jgi:hypothetical protein
MSASSQSEVRTELATPDGPTDEHAGAVETSDTRAAVDESGNDTRGEGYRLVSIEAVRAPPGCGGKDWFVYRITQGENAITGYRRGDRDRVGAEVDTIVAGLNGRREWTKRKKDAKGERRAAAARRAAAE